MRKEINMKDTNQKQYLNKISHSLWSLMEMGIKTTGEYVNSLNFICESLTFKELNTLEDFYKWIENGPKDWKNYPERTIGHSNYNDRYQEFLMDELKKKEI